MDWIQSRGLLLSAFTFKSVLRGDEECFTTLQLQPGHNIWISTHHYVQPYIKLSTAQIGEWQS